MRSHVWDIEGLVTLDMLEGGGQRSRGHCMAGDLASCMQKSGAGVYEALGWITTATGFLVGRTGTGTGCQIGELVLLVFSKIENW